MSWELLEEARRQLSHLREQVRVLEQFVDSYESLRLSPRNSETPRARRRKRGSPDALAQKCREIILSRGHPMTRGELLSELERLGVELPRASNQAQNLGTRLWRSKQFVNLGERRGYWPAGVELPSEENSLGGRP